MSIDDLYELIQKLQKKLKWLGRAYLKITLDNKSKVGLGLV